MRENPKPFEIYRHFKGNLYQIITIATDSEDGSKKVVYQALYEPFGVYVRDLSMFMEPVDENKYPDKAGMNRFEKVTVFGKEEVKEEVKAEPAKKDLQEEAFVKEENTKTEKTAVNEDLMNFLKARNYSEKLDVLTMARQRIDSRILDQMAVSIDITLPEGNMNEKYEQLKAALMTRDKYEQVRRS